MTYVMIYLLIGLVGKLTDLFGIECIDIESQSENAVFSLLASMLAWPAPFACLVKDIISGE